MAKIGYVRVSSKDQKYDRQYEKLKAEEVEMIFEDKLSGKDTNGQNFKNCWTILEKGI